MKRWLILWRVALVVAIVAALLPSGLLAERLSRPVIWALSQGTSRVPFPIAEPLALGALSIAAWAMGRSVALCVREKSASPLWRTLRRLSGALCAVVLSFMLVWQPVATARRLPLSPGHTREELRALAHTLSDRAHALRETLPAAMPDDRAALIEKAEANIGWVTIKRARYPEWMTKLGIAGIMFPLTGEAIVNPSESPITLPFAASHEAAHLLGYGREDEANYVAYRWMMDGDHILRYSATMYALRYTMDALRAADPAAWQAIVDHFSLAVHGDFYALSGHQNGERVQGARWVSDAFLRLSGQDGLSSYGRMVDLLMDEPTLPE